MKFTFLGTAAAEGMPAVFCNCRFCQRARELGGKEIRTRSQAIINDDLLLDLPADTYAHFLQNNIRGDKIKYVFFTHSHQDHLYTGEFNMRNGAYAHDMEVPTLQVYCTQGAYGKLKEYPNVSVTLIKPYERVTAGDYEVISLPARHYDGDEAVFYIIKQGDKTILYAHDTGLFFDEVMEYLEKEKFQFDFISFDCTNGDLIFKDTCSHMGFNHIGRVMEKLKSFGAITDKTILYVNHFSHNGNPITENLQKLADPLGLKIAYDGLQVEI